MRRKRDKKDKDLGTRTMVYTYWARLEEDQEDLLWTELRKQRAYKKKLAEIVNASGARWREINREHDEKLAEIEDRIKEIEALLEEIDKEAKKHRVKVRGRPDQPEKKAEKKNLLADKKVLRAEERAIKAALKEKLEPYDLLYEETVEQRGGATLGNAALGRLQREVQLEMIANPDIPALWRDRAQCNLDRKRAELAARAESDLHHGSYLFVEKAIEASVKKNRGAPIRANLDALALGTQVLRPASCEIEPLPASTWDTRSGRRHAYAHVRLWVGRAERFVRDAQGAVVRDEQGNSRLEPNPARSVAMSIIQARPLPPGAKVTWAYLVPQRRAERTRYHLQLTIDVPVPEAPAARRFPRVAVDDGWRVMPDGSIRVGYVVSDTEHFEIRLPPKFIKDTRFYESLGSIRDKHFDQARPRIALVRDWLLRVAPSDPATLAFAKEMEFVHQIRSCARARRAVERLIHGHWGKDEAAARWLAWRQERLRADLDLLDDPSFLDEPEEAHLAWLQRWAQKDRHLAVWKSGGMERLRLHRREIYRVAAARLAARYETVIVEGSDRRELARRPEATSKDTIAEDKMQSIRVIAAPSELVMALKNAFFRRWQEAPPADTTSTCHECGGLCEWDQAKELEHTCEHCGAHWDQDYNAGQNFLGYQRQKQAAE